MKRLSGCFPSTLFILLLLLILSPATEVAAQDADLQATARYLKGIVEKPDYQGMLDWPILALAGAGQEVGGMINRREEQVRKGELFDSLKSTDYQRTLVAVAAAGKDPQNFAMKNFIKDIKASQLPNGKFADTIAGKGERLVNAHIWGIISLYAAGEAIPDINSALSWLERHQKEDGGFSIDVNVPVSDVDITAMALMAFAALGKDRNYPAVRKALRYLQSQQAENGGFAGWGGSGSDSISQVIQGLMMLGIDPAGKEWTKSSGNPVSALALYRLRDGSYSREIGGKSDTISTYQALIALGDYFRGESIYRVLHRQNIHFNDVPGSHYALPAIRELVKRGIFTGYGDGTFRPDAPVSRAQFAVLLVRSMAREHLVGNVTTKFADLPIDHWANSYIKVAVDAGLIQGLGGEPPQFAPEANINGAQMATLLVKALGEEQKAKEKGGREWYAGYVALAREKGLLYPGFGEERAATRAQVAWSLQRWLRCSLQ